MTTLHKHCVILQVCAWPGDSEFLKAAIMQSHNCAKDLRIRANFGLMSVKQEKVAQNVMYLAQVDKVLF